MAIYTYGANNIAFSTFDTWANNISGQTNTSLTTTTNNFSPANAAPYQVSEFAPSTVIFYGSIVAGTGGTVSLTSPYSQGVVASFTVKNFKLNSYTLTLVAVPTYPYVFHSWRTAASGGGTQLGTSATLSISNASSSTLKNPTTYYAYFT
jgi:hypothetical protein